MPTRWIIGLASLALFHFAATAGSHVFVFSQCRETVDQGCQLARATASALSFPLLPIAMQFSTGMLGWRSGFIVFVANSALVSTVIVGVILALRSSRRPAQ